MGQVVKYVVRLGPRAVKYITRPASGWLGVLLLLQQFGLVACLLIFALVLSGVSWQPRSEAEGLRRLVEQLQLHLDRSQIWLPLLGTISHEASPGAGRQDITPADNWMATAGSKEPLTGSSLEPAAPEPGPSLPANTEASSSPVEASQQEPEPAYVRVVAGAGKRVALTFDDGPFPEWTERYLRVLEATHTPATFFMIGMQAADQPELVQAILAGGHEVASHSWRHANLSQVSLAETEADLRQAAMSIEEITGAPVKYFRPPYGALSPDLLAAAEKIGLRTVNWSVDPRDWSNPGPQVIIQRVMDNVFEGSIIILHEAHPGTLTALPVLIKQLRDQGYELVTISDLIASGQPRQD